MPPDHTKGEDAREPRMIFPRSTHGRHPWDRLAVGESFSVSIEEWGTGGVASTIWRAGQILGKRFRYRTEDQSIVIRRVE